MAIRKETRILISENKKFINRGSSTFGGPTYFVFAQIKIVNCGSFEHVPINHTENVAAGVCVRRYVVFSVSFIVHHRVSLTSAN